MEDSAAHKSDWDVVVVGSGAGGLSTAVAARKLGLDVVVVEKEPFFGGTTARSGGVLWIPGSQVAKRVGVVDDPEAARTYLRALTGNAYDAERIDTFLREGPRMIDFFERETSVKFVAQPAFPDYRADMPGAAAGGRSIVAAPLDGRELGSRLGQLRPPLREITFVGMMFNASQEVQHFFRATRSLKSALYVARRLIVHAAEVARYGRATRLTNGNALAARLAKSAFDLKVPLLVSTPLRALVVETGQVVGVMLDQGGQAVRLNARLGVVLAGGGFPNDPTRQQTMFPHVSAGGQHLSPGSPGNTGDTLRAAEAVGAVVEDTLPNAAAWIPVSKVPHKSGPGVFPHLIDRYKPGVIAVAPNGRRFVNEADSYHEVGQAMQAACKGRPETFAWLICDQRALKRYGLGFVKPFPVPIGQHLRSGYLLRGRTVAELAKKIDVDPTILEGTIARFNADAALGLDHDFNRGTTPYNRYLGDPEHKPNPALAPLKDGPFYAIRMVLGDLGTFAGLRANARGQVLDAKGAPIEGLYAAGNDMASIMGGAYPGGGITLGPAMTFGYVVAHSLADKAKAVEARTENRTGSEHVATRGAQVQTRLR